MQPKLTALERLRELSKINRIRMRPTKREKKVDRDSRTLRDLFKEMK